MNYNSKGYLNITHFKEKVHMVNIYLHDIFDELNDVNDVVPNGTPRL
jgi:hypothetical protein